MMPESRNFNEEIKLNRVAPTRPRFSLTHSIFFCFAFIYVFY